MAVTFYTVSDGTCCCGEGTGTGTGTGTVPDDQLVSCCDGIIVPATLCYDVTVSGSDCTFLNHSGTLRFGIPTPGPPFITTAMWWDCFEFDDSFVNPEILNPRPFVHIRLFCEPHFEEVGGGTGQDARWQWNILFFIGDGAAGGRCVPNTTTLRVIHQPDFPVIVECEPLCLYQRMDGFTNSTDPPYLPCIGPSVGSVEPDMVVCLNIYDCGGDPCPCPAEAEACEHCDGDDPGNTITLTAADFTDGTCSGCTSANGMHTLTKTEGDPCVWEGPTFTFCGTPGAGYWRLTRSSGNWKAELIGPLTGVEADYQANVEDCDLSGGVTLDIVTSSAACDRPNTISISA